jgi:hypothetical protein
MLRLREGISTMVSQEHPTRRCTEDTNSVQLDGIVANYGFLQSISFFLGQQFNYANDQN